MHKTNIRLVSAACVACTLLVVLSACGGKSDSDSAVVRQRGRDPWVVRSVLDGRVRMLTAALAPQLWVAYDTQHAALHRVWQDGVNFDGAVYNAHHGPQPTSLGRALLAATIEQPWQVLREGAQLSSTVQYRGHRFDRQQVLLMYSLHLADGSEIRIEERPEVITLPDGSLGLERVFTASGIPNNTEVVLALEAAILDAQQNVKVLGNEGGAGARALLTLQRDVATRLVMRFPPMSEPDADASASSAELTPEQLIANSDCVACHNPTARTVGPSFKQVAEHYRTNEQTIAGVARRIIEGGGNEFGDAAMVAHPTLRVEDAQAIAKYILTTYDPEDKLGERSTHELTSDVEEEEEPRAPYPPGAPGDRRPLEAVHPSFTLSAARPQSFKPMVGGMDFLPDGRLVVSTWDARGSVYVLSNLQADDPEKIQIQEIASGLFEPLGLKVVEGVPYVLQKHELTKLVDTNGDTVIDEYRTVSDRWGVNANFHLFAFGLEYRDGHFYGTLATEILPGGTSAQPQIADRGKVMKIAKDSGAIEYIAQGLRTPNGIGPGVDDELFVTDNQGDWLPANKLVHLQAGAFYGSRSVDPVGTANMPVTPPVAWLPQDDVANSPSQPLPLNAGPYQNQMLYGDVTFGGLSRIVTQKIGGIYQGCVLPFTQGLEAGVNRASVGPDGSIYVGGIGNPGNWSQTGKQWFGLQRLTYSGAPTFEMLDVKLRSDGIELTFTEPMRAGDGIRPSDYEVRQWHYVPTAEYGGPHVGEHALPVRSVHVAADRRRAFLEIGGIKKDHVLYVRLAQPMIAESNRELWATETWCTINSIPSGARGERYGAGQPVAAMNSLTDAEKAAGWRLLFDGTSARGWHTFRGGPPNASWQAKNGALTLSPGGKGGDIATDEEFGDFELDLEWRIASGGNSGIFYRALESAAEIWHAAPEMQILDDQQHEDRLVLNHRAGAAYDLYVAQEGVVRPPGEFNRARILVRGSRVEHWLNGHKVLEYDTSSADWKQKLASSKFAAFPQFAAARRGRIGLQDHGDAVWFRNIKIRHL